MSKLSVGRERRVTTSETRAKLVIVCMNAMFRRVGASQDWGMGVCFMVC